MNKFKAPPNIATFFLRIPLSAMFMQQGLSKLPVDGAVAEAWGLPYIVWWFVTWGEIGAAIGLRGEFFSETDGFGALVEDGDADNFSVTLTGSFTSGNFIFKPEFRIDSCSSEIFAISPTEMANNLESFVIAAIYQF